MRKEKIKCYKNFLLIICMVLFNEYALGSNSLSSIPALRYENFNIYQDLSNELFVHYVTPFDYVYDIKQDGNEIWFALVEGVLRYNTLKKEWYLYTRSDGLEYDEIHRIGITKEYIYAISIYNRKTANRYDKERKRWEIVDYSTLPKIDFEQSQSRITDILKRKAASLIYRVNCVLETEKNIWFGGFGIACYNKRTQKWNYWKSWDEGQNDITSMAKINDDILWFGTRSGLIEFNKKEKKWFRYTTDEGLVDNVVSLIVRYEDMVLVASEKGVAVYNITKKRWEDIFVQTEENFDNITALYFNKEELWLGTDRGLFIYDVVEKIWKNELIPPSLVSTKISGIIEYDDRIWIGSKRGLYEYKEDFKEWKRYNYDVSKKSLLEIAVDNNDRINNMQQIEPEYYTEINIIALEKDYLLIGLTQIPCFDVCRDLPFQTALIKYNLINNQTVELPVDPKIPIDAIKKIDFDNQNIWFATDVGLFKVDKDDLNTVLYTGINDDNLPNSWIPQINALVESRINTVVIDDNLVWCGTSRGISIYDTITNEWRSFISSGMHVNYPLDIIVGKDAIWVQTSYKLSSRAYPWAKFDKKERRWKHIDYGELWGATYRSLKIEDNILWFGTSDGVRSIDLATKFMNYYPVGKPVWNVYIINKNVWAATEGDIRKLDKKTNGWDIYYFDPKKVDRTFNSYNTNVLSFVVDDQYVWIGNNKGVCRFDMAKKVFEYLNDKVNNEAIGAIIPDNNITWLIGSRGNAYIFHNKDQSVQIIKGKTSYIHYVINDLDYILCASNNEGILVLDKKKRDWVSISKIGWASFPSPRALALDNDDLWIGNSRGILKVNFNKFKELLIKSR